MNWKEFASLIRGLNGDTPLGIVVAIRAENNPDALKDFTPEQRRIRSEWRNKQAKLKPQNEVDSFIESMKQMFIDLAGETNGD